MNDKNFIEELRQKREEYGVTQRKLAVACGISRTYFNQGMCLRQQSALLPEN